MSEFAISISWLNDFVFCPVSIYFHGLDEESEKMTYQSPDQLNGTAAHRTVDSATYSPSPDILQGISIYSETYDLIGKIDVFDEKKGILRERKKRIHAIYDGQIFQVYGQSEKILYNIIAEINNKFLKVFDQSDSVYIFHMSASCKVQKFGYAQNEDSPLLIV